MNTGNKYGLKRSIPAATKRLLRQEASFGCVKCGNAFCEYEHIEPEFSEAREHDASRMAFLCTRCHGEVTAGRASKESVWKAKAAPFCRTQGKPSHGLLEFGSLTSTLGDTFFHDCRVILRVLGEDLLSIEPPEEAGGPIRVNARLYDGPKVSLEIENNGIAISADNWDVDIEGDRLTVRRALGEPSLIYRFIPTRGIRIERLNMAHKGISIVVDDGAISVDGNRRRFHARAQSTTFMSCETCIDVREDCVSMGGVSAASGGTINLRGCVVGPRDPK